MSHLTDKVIDFAADVLGDVEGNLDVTVRFHIRKGVCDEVIIERDVPAAPYVAPSAKGPVFFETGVEGLPSDG